MAAGADGSHPSPAQPAQPCLAGVKQCWPARTETPTPVAGPARPHGDPRSRRLRDSGRASPALAVSAGLLASYTRLRYLPGPRWRLEFATLPLRHHSDGFSAEADVGPDCYSRCVPRTLCSHAGCVSWCAAELPKGGPAPSWRERAGAGEWKQVGSTGPFSFISLP